MAHRPLAAVRVLDLTNVLAGPFCCHQLAHMGADVIKVEMPGTGDLARQLGADPALNRAGMGVSFLAQNPGKRSVTINLKHRDGKAVFMRLVGTADVVVENFRPGVMDRLGLGYQALAADYPGVIYCAISGFGQDGPLRDNPAYDQIVQGMAGVMSVTGDAETAPYRVGYPVADTIGGLTAAFAIAAALAGRDGRGGTGTFIDVSMLEATIATMGWLVSDYLIAGRTPAPLGNENVTASPSGTFRTGDGPINIAANKQAQFAALCRVVDRPALIDDPRFAERTDRLDNRVALKAALEEALAVQPATEWEARLNAVGVPAGRVLTVPEVLTHRQVRDRGMIGTFADVPGVDRDIRVVRTGVKLDGVAPAVDTPPPRLGEYTEAILDELGYSADEIAQLKAESAI